MEDAGWRDASTIPWLSWSSLGITFFAGLTMVTNLPFYSFKVVGGRRTVPFAVIVAVALGIALVNVHPPIVLFCLFLSYGLSGYVIYVYRKSKGRPVSVIATSTDEPEERGLH
jgi:CDP-diacylglycerol--serine O-phosphatidyltransferase